MTANVKNFVLSLSVGLAILCAAPAARANEGDQESTVTFEAPIALAGKGLPAGAYIFKRTADESDHGVVEIYKEGESEPVATFVSREEASEETAAGRDEDESDECPTDAVAPPEKIFSQPAPFNVVVLPVP